MPIVTVTAARRDLYRLVDQVQESHEPIQISGKRGNAVLVGEDDWRAIQETLYGYGEEVESNSVEVHMSRLRKKLAAAEAQFEIHTIRGVGYFVPEEKR